MWYLIEQLFWFLLVAFVIGMIVGWVTSEKKPV
jgi:hypothetical protein